MNMAAFVLELIAVSDLHTLLPATLCQLTAESVLQNGCPLANRMSLHHDLTGDNHFTDVSYWSMVPGILPNQFEILFTGQT